MTPRLPPAVLRSGFAPGTVRGRIRNLHLVVLVVLVSVGISIGTVAMADVVASIARAS
ncbi:MAG: hypothetical protein ACKV2T_14240 [Kofleriaceae bacterium]